MAKMQKWQCNFKLNLASLLVSNFQWPNQFDHVHSADYIFRVLFAISWLMIRVFSWLQSKVTRVLGTFNWRHWIINSTKGKILPITWHQKNAMNVIKHIDALYHPDSCMHMSCFYKLLFVEILIEGL